MAKSRTKRPSPAGYSGTPLPKKLGIKPGSIVALIDAPRGFRATLGAVPAGVKFSKTMPGAGLTLWFVRSRLALEAGICEVAREIGDGHLWIIWAKKSSPLATDVTEDIVRDRGLSCGLVDFKVCAVDTDWSGLLFCRRRTVK